MSTCKYCGYEIDKIGQSCRAGMRVSSGGAVGFCDSGKFEPRTFVMGVLLYAVIFFTIIGMYTFFFK